MDNLLVSTAWPEEHLHNANLRIVDVRGHAISASNCTAGVLLDSKALPFQCHIEGSLFGGTHFTRRPTHRNQQSSVLKGHIGQMLSLFNFCYLAPNCVDDDDSTVRLYTL